MKNLSRFLKLYRPYKWHVVAGVSLSLLTLCAGIFLLAVSGWFIAAMGIAGAASISMNYFTPAAMIRGLAIIRTTGRYGERVANHDAALRVTSTFREWFYNRLEPLAPAGLSDLHSADVLSRLRGDVDVLERFYLNGIVPLCTAAIALVILTVGLAFYHVPLALLEVSLLLTAGLVVPMAMRAKAHKDEDAISRKKVMLNVDLAEMLYGMPEYLVYSRMDNQIATIQQHDAEIAQARKAINHRESLLQGCLVLLSGLSLTAALYLMIPLVTDGIIQPADLAAVALFCLACFDIVSPLPAALQSFQAARLAAERIFKLADRPVPYHGEAIKKVMAPDATIVEARNISFSYGNAEIIKNLSFSILRGDVVVIAGRSGAGKTTLIDLLTGLLSPKKGEIIFNEEFADYITAQDFSAVASQKPYFFADTLKANLTFGDSKISQSDLDEITRVTQLDEVLKNMPEAYETYVGEHGTRLSGGQLRRAELARALLKPSAILVLDEPGEGLDAGLEAKVMQSVLRYAHQRQQAVILCLHDTHKNWLPADIKVINL